MTDPVDSSAKAIVVLVVEDEPLVRMLAHDTLATAGFEVVEAVNADEALVLLTARPDVAVLVTDVNMPGEINGYGLAQLAAKRNADMAIVVCSGGPDWPGEGDMPQGAEFIEKPYAPSVLLNTVKRLSGDS